jgi:hypothetical protein
MYKFSPIKSQHRTINFRKSAPSRTACGMVFKGLPANGMALKLVNKPSSGGSLAKLLFERLRSRRLVKVGTPAPSEVSTFSWALSSATESSKPSSSGSLMSLLALTSNSTSLLQRPRAAGTVCSASGRLNEECFLMQSLSVLQRSF